MPEIYKLYQPKEIGDWFTLRAPLVQAVRFGSHLCRGLFSCDHYFSVFFSVFRSKKVLIS